MTQEEIVGQLQAQFGAAVGALSENKGDRFVVVKGDRIVEVCRFLKTTTGLEFDYCQDITAVDWPAKKLIEVVFHLYSLAQRHALVLKVETDREKPVVPTVEGVWKAANWLEREIYDLFGVNFTGHSDLRRILLPDDWVGHPLRKDYQEAGGFHGIENVRVDPLVQLTKVTDEKRKAIAAEAAAKAAQDAAAAAAAAPVAPTEGAPPATATTTTTATTTASGSGTSPVSVASAPSAAPPASVASALSAAPPASVASAPSAAPPERKE